MGNEANYWQPAIPYPAGEERGGEQSNMYENISSPAVWTLYLFGLHTWTLTCYKRDQRNVNDNYKRTPTNLEFNFLSGL